MMPLRRKDILHRVWTWSRIIFMARKTQAGVTWRPWREFIVMLLISPVFSDRTVSVPMGCLRLVGSFNLYVSFAEYSLFYRALLQKRPMFVRSLLIAATPYQRYYMVLRDRTVNVLDRKVESVVPITGWRRPVGCLISWITFRKRATNYRALLRRRWFLLHETELSWCLSHDTAHMYIYMYMYMYMPSRSGY